MLKTTFLGLMLLCLSSDAGAEPISYDDMQTGGYITSREYFGMHIHRLKPLIGEGNPADRTTWPDTDIGSLRLWDAAVSWEKIAPAAGVWEFGRLDHYVLQGTQHKTQLLYLLGNTPRWVSSRPDEPCSYGLGCAAEPVKMAHWQEYVRRVATRYKGRIAAYEVWNEPNFSNVPRDFENFQKTKAGFYKGSVENMVEMVRLARKVLDEADPNAILLSPGFVNGPDRLDLFLEKGGGQYVQAIAYHFYTDHSVNLVRQINEVRAVMAKHGYQNLPLWNTETGVEVHANDKTLPPGANAAETNLSAAARMSQYLILGASQGLQRYFYYAWDNDFSGMYNRQGKFTPERFEAYNTSQQWLLDTTLRPCKLIAPDKRAYSCSADRDGKRYIFAWSDLPQEYPLQIPAGWQISTIENLARTPIEMPNEKGKALKIKLSIQPIRIELSQKN